MFPLAVGNAARGGDAISGCDSLVVGKDTAAHEFQLTASPSAAPPRASARRDAPSAFLCGSFYGSDGNIKNKRGKAVNV